MKRKLKLLAATWASHFYLRNKVNLWAGYRTSKAIDDTAECLRRLLPGHIDVNPKIVTELLSDIEGVGELRALVEKYRGVIGKDWDEKLNGKTFASVLFCFAALRLSKPEVVVETGCATGWDSAMILLALEFNQKGHLYSIDLPAKAGQAGMNWTLPAELSTGFLVPDFLRSRWTLTLGDVRDHLLPLLKKEKAIDVFFHDSDHSYTHMMWEYTCAWPHLKPGGFLLSDDVNFNTAFGDFASGVDRPMIIHSSNIGFAALSRPS